MDEIKCVKVDNWGVFFLQKLQNFFNKTDYCDLTLQFRDNSQLKVHRLVLSACTDYFNVLEQTCEVVDDALIMPNELQADVVVPIVNFMYTGTLEFELRMYGKLLRTAKEMNMTVLLKLLEAHRRTMEGVNRAQRPPSPKPPRRRGIPQQAPQRRILTAANTSPQRRLVQTKTTGTNASEQPFHYRQQIGNTSLMRTTTSGSAPIKIEFEQQLQPPTSPFEQLRKGYNNNKRPNTTTFTSPPAKRPNIEDVKEFAEQQRMRKQIAAEYGDDPEYEGVLDDDIHADDDDDDTAVASVSTVAQNAPNHQQSQQHVVKQEPHENKPPTIVVKDSSNSKMDHSKIIAEVLRQYPHLVRSNKNIKLKILPTVGGAAQKIILKKETVGHQAETARATQQQQQPQPQQSPQQITKPPAAVQVERHVSQPLPTKVVAPPAEAATASSQTAGNPIRRRIDSKTMHNLIALGAENTTGPWLCLRCGVNGRPISIPSYRGFRRHLINTHKESIDSALCEHCGYRSQNHRELHFHIQIEHKIKTTLYTFPECQTCAEVFIDAAMLNEHMVSSHPESKQQCIYCNKIFAQELQLFTHMKTYHYKQAVGDGIIDETDEEYLDSQPEDQNDEQDSNDVQDTRVKILSNISLPTTGSLVKMEPNPETTAVNSVPNAANTSGEEFMQTETLAATEPKFVNEDGTEMVLTEEQRKEIMSHLNQEHENGSVVMLLNDQIFNTDPETATTAASAEEAVDATAVHMEQPEDEQTTDEAEAPIPMEEEYDDSQIYKEFLTHKSPVVEAETPVEVKESDSVNLNASKESAENLEWAENLVLEDEEANSKSIEQKDKTSDDISKKLKELTGDWSEDDNDENEAENTTGETMPDSIPDDSQAEFIFDAAQKKAEIAEAEPTSIGPTHVDEQKDVNTAAPVVEPEVDKEDTNPDPSIDEHDIEHAMQTVQKELDTAETEHNEDVPKLAEAVAEQPKEILQEVKEEEETEEIIKETAAVVNETGLIAVSEATVAEEEGEAIKVEEADATQAGVEESADIAIQDKKALLDQLMAEVKDDEDDDNTEGKNEETEQVKDSIEEALGQHELSEDGTTVKADDSADKETPLTPAQTAEKVKSLISEWGEDDEDMEETAEAN